MALTPFSRLLGQDLARAFSLLEEPLLTTSRRFPAAYPSLTQTIRPSVDVSETETTYIVEAEVPGMNKEDLQVEFLDDGTLILKGKNERVRQEGDADQTSGNQSEAVVSSEGKTLTYWSNERQTGIFQRLFHFPGRIDHNNVKAKYKNGILSILVPKAKREGVKINIEEEN
ncbi:10474_t:CDS:1 [Paraglomus brasilianum]|uniref:10474_t:CDS:1 n=1 Tax=Paraglomus brasilianum TaxID=144538 RepID=A0A9N9F7V5_9GLOM|nr:10474_t:CDS:1 [Paraglomus brasilianum]